MQRHSELDVRVTHVELEHGIDAGIQMRVLGDELVPPFEEHSTRAERGIRLTEWETMPYMEKVFLIALRRVANSIKNLQAEAEITEMERKNKRAGKGRK